jgi:hypothetical protein
MVFESVSAARLAMSRGVCETGTGVNTTSPAATIRMSGPVAQWLEQQTHNLLVVGSSPTGPTKYVDHPGPVPLSCSAQTQDGSEHKSDHKQRMKT